jgi:serine/threonine-protein kinase
MTLDERFDLVGLLGIGGFGTVYLAIEQGLPRFVAVKVLQETRSENAVTRRRFKAEAHALAALSSDHIVQIVAAGSGFVSDPGSATAAAARRQLYLITEFVAGDTLSDLLNRDGAQPVEVVVGLARQVLAGLAEAHAHGIIHRDLKPSNAIAAYDRLGNLRVKVLDFGIAKLLEHHTGPSTATGHVVGTARYMAPEQLVGGPIGPPTDLFALGVMIYELIEGVPLFDADNQQALLGKRLGAPRPELPQRWPSKLRVLVSKALATNPSNRFATATEMAEALAALGPEAMGAEQAVGGGAAAPERSLATMHIVPDPELVALARIKTPAVGGFAPMPEGILAQVSNAQTVALPKAKRGPAVQAALAAPLLSPSEDGPSGDESEASEGVENRTLWEVLHDPCSSILALAASASQGAEPLTPAQFEASRVAAPRPDTGHVKTLQGPVRRAVGWRTLAGLGGAGVAVLAVALLGWGSGDAEVARPVADRAELAGHLRAAPARVASAATVASAAIAGNAVPSSDRAIAPSAPTAPVKVAPVILLAEAKPPAAMSRPDGPAGVASAPPVLDEAPVTCEALRAAWHAARDGDVSTKVRRHALEACAACTEDGACARAWGKHRTCVHHGVKTENAIAAVRKAGLSAGLLKRVYREARRCRYQCRGAPSSAAGWNENCQAIERCSAAVAGILAGNTTPQECRARCKGTSTGFRLCGVK